MPLQTAPPNPCKVAVDLYDVICRAADVDESPIAKAAKDEYREVIDAIVAQMAEEEQTAEK